MPQRDCKCGLYGNALSAIWLEHGFENTVWPGLIQSEHESACVFDINDAEAFIKSYLAFGPEGGGGGTAEAVQPLSISGKRVRAVPEEWIDSFGKQYYLHQHSLQLVRDQSEEDWKIRMEGQLYETGQKLHVTGFEELRNYIRQEFSQCGKEEL